MDNLPTEVLIIIFKKFISSLDLLKLRQVSRRWADIIDGILENSKFWESLCRGNIKPWIFEIFEKIFPYVMKKRQKILYQYTWKKIYLSYQKLQTNLKFPYFYTNFNFVQIFSVNEEITCMDTWANFLAVGTSVGKVYVFNTKNFPQLLFTGGHENRYITTIKFWYAAKKKLIAAVSLENESLEFWDIENHQKITSPYKNQPSVAIACKGHRLFIADDNEVLECKWNNNRVLRGNEAEFQTSTNLETVQRVKIIGISASRTKLIVVRSDFDYALIATLKIPSSSSNFIPLPEESSILRMEPTRNNEFICYIPINDVILIINDWYLYVSIKNPLSTDWTSTIYAFAEDLQTTISSVLFYSNILIFGLKSGSIRISYLDNIQNLLNINLNETFSKTLELDTKPITHLSVTKFNEIIRVFATTESKLYIVQFFDRAPEQQIV